MMIKSTIVVLLLINVFSLKAEESKKDNQRMITSNPFELLPIKNVIFWNLTYTQKLDSISAFSIEAKLPASSSVEGYGIGGEYRWYPLNSSLERLYIAGRLSYFDISDDIAEAQVFAIGPVIGWQFIIGPHVTIGLGFGIDYNTGPQLQEQELEANRSNISPNFRFDLGWSW